MVLARGIIFLDLAVAQLAGLGVVTAHAQDLAADDWPTQLAAAAAALIGATVRLVGVYLVFASLILPALAVRSLPSGSGRRGDRRAGVCGWTGCVCPARLAGLTRDCHCARRVRPARRHAAAACCKRGTALVSITEPLTKARIFRGPSVFQKKQGQGTRLRAKNRAGARSRH